MSFRAIAIAGLMTAVSTAADAQVVQQPVVSGFSVDTVVSVPDRGAAFSGGVLSGQSGSRSAGPLRGASSIGRSFQGAATETRVFIHDFEAMDAALLSQGQPPAAGAARSTAPGATAVLIGPTSRPQMPVTRAERARAHLLERWKDRTAPAPLPSAASPGSRTSIATRP
jgi:hypothetical protein